MKDRVSESSLLTRLSRYGGYTVHRKATGKAAIRSNPYIGCAGWSIPKEHAEHFPDTGTHLERYAAAFRCVEINSSFYRSHRETTYVRWAAAVPDDFRFAVKVPQRITHVRRLIDFDDLLAPFINEVRGLGEKLGPLLIQLPPSLSLDFAAAEKCFGLFRDRFAGDLVCEPRHTSWFQAEATHLMKAFKIARVAADPAVIPMAREPGGWEGVMYYRLHGSPKMYYSSYSREYLNDLSERLVAAAQTACVWCIFDNTALFAATADALELGKRISPK